MSWEDWQTIRETTYPEDCSTGWGIEQEAQEGISIGTSLVQFGKRVIDRAVRLDLARGEAISIIEGNPLLLVHRGHILVVDGRPRRWVGQGEWTRLREGWGLMPWEPKTKPKVEVNHWESSRMRVNVWAMPDGEGTYTHELHIAEYAPGRWSTWGTAESTVVVRNATAVAHGHHLRECLETAIRLVETHYGSRLETTRAVAWGDDNLYDRSAEERRGREAIDITCDAHDMLWIPGPSTHSGICQTLLAGHGVENWLPESATRIARAWADTIEGEKWADAKRRYRTYDDD